MDKVMAGMDKVIITAGPKDPSNTADRSLVRSLVRAPARLTDRPTGQYSGGRAGKKKLQCHGAAMDARALR